MTSRKNVLLTLLTVAVICGAVQAQGTGKLVRVNQIPQSVLVVVNGKAVLIPLSEYFPETIDIEGGGTPPLPPPPPTGSLKEISQKEAAKLNDPQKTQQLAVGYSVVLELAKGGRFGTARELQDAIGEMTNNLLMGSSATKWKPWRDATLAKLTELQQDGKLKTVNDFVGAYASIRDGLADSLGKSARGTFERAKEAIENGDLKNIDLTGILELVQSVIKLFEPDGFSLPALLELVVKVIAIFT